MDLKAPPKLEFGNEEHIRLRQKGELIARLMALDPNDAQEAEEHECDCEHCDIDRYSCPECGSSYFEVFKDCEVPCPYAPQTDKVTRRFCIPCEIEVKFY